MRVIEGRNVNYNYAELLRTIRREGVLQPSRAGEVFSLPEPVTLVTRRPQERVLLDPRRDANPFFHFFEALFLLAGRDDYTWLDRFVRDFSVRFAEPNGHGHGSYGRRWRYHFGFDQLDAIVAKLRADPNDRRVVLQMWDGTPHYVNGDGDQEADDLRVDARDVPCNTHCYPRICTGPSGPTLDLMVCCRSNDAIWGATGANAVQFSMLQEYLAGRIGVGVGTLYQVTSNMHAYTTRLGRYGEPALKDRWEADEYIKGEIQPVPIGTDWDQWDSDLDAFMRSTEDDVVFAFSNLWFVTVASEMWATHELFAKGDKPAALERAQRIAAPDWALAARRWIERRMK